MIGEILNWWLRQLADLVPTRLKPSGGAAADGLIIAITDLPDHGGPPLSRAMLINRRNGKEFNGGLLTASIGRLVRSRTRPGQNASRVYLRVPPQLLLECEVVLPLAAERELENVLRYELDQLTPFKAEQLYWTAETARRDTARGKLTLRLSMIQRASIAAVVTALREAGLSLAAIEVAPAGAASAPPRIISLSDHHLAARATSGASRFAAVCGALAFVAVVLPFAQQSRRDAALNQALTRLSSRVVHTEALRERIDAANGNILDAARQHTGDPLAVLAAVTSALPDNSYLNELTLNHRQLNITGQASAAAPLLSAMSAYPILSGVAFSAPVTRAGDKDMFSIQASVAP